MPGPLASLIAGEIQSSGPISFADFMELALYHDELGFYAGAGGRAGGRRGDFVTSVEAGILFGLKLPLLIFREPTITGGVFDPGVTDVFVHQMPTAESLAGREGDLRQVFLKWHAKVSGHYYTF